VKPVFKISAEGFGLTDIDPSVISSVTDLTQLSTISGIFILSVVILLFYRYLHLRSRVVSFEPTWGCGYTSPGPKQQYTATSYAYNYNHLAKPVLQTEKIMKEIREDEIFPARRTFRSHSYDIFRNFLINKPVDLITGFLKQIAVMQTGRIQHYILYAFIFMLIVLILTYFNII
jgi:hydrogenase-4 component B